jgi:type I restriction enzyme, S subunit
MNRTLEELAQVLYRSWFVDFDSHHDFVESDLGLIPRGWKTTSLGNHVTLQRGTTYKGKLKNKPGPFLLGLASIHREGRFRSDKLVPYGGESPEKLLVRAGDLYVSLKDVTQAGDLLGAVARMPTSHGIGRLTQDTVRLDPVVGSLPSSVIYRTLLSVRCRRHFKARRTGTTTSALSRDDFLGYRFAVPEDWQAIDPYLGIEKSLSEGQETNAEESRTLAILRDTVLAKLLIGDHPSNVAMRVAL